MFSGIHNEEEAEERLPLLDLEQLTQIPVPPSIKWSFYTGAVMGLIEMGPRTLASKLLADSFFNITTFGWVVCADVIAIEMFCIWRARRYKPQENVADSAGCNRLGHVADAFRQGLISPRRFSSQRNLLRGRVEDMPATWKTRLGAITGGGIAFALSSPYLLYVIGAQTIDNATSSSIQLIICYLQSQPSCTPATLLLQDLASYILFPLTLIMAGNNIYQARPARIPHGIGFIDTFKQAFELTVRAPNPAIKKLLITIGQQVKALCSSSSAEETIRLVDVEPPPPSKRSMAMIFIGIIIGAIRLTIAMYFLLAPNLDVPIGLSPPSGTDNISGTQLTFSFGLLVLGAFVTLLRFSSPTTPAPTTTSWMNFLSDLFAHPFQAPAKIAASIGWCGRDLSTQELYQPINEPQPSGYGYV